MYNYHAAVLKGDIMPHWRSQCPALEFHVVIFGPTLTQNRPMESMLSVADWTQQYGLACWLALDVHAAPAHVRAVLEATLRMLVAASSSRRRGRRSRR